MEEHHEALFDHLREELGRHGERAVEFLRTARHLVELDDLADVERVPEAAVYCLREAVKEIPLAAEPGAEWSSWRDASREVTVARDRYLIARGLPGSDVEGSLEELLESIVHLESIHKQSSIHQARLIALMVARSGATPLGEAVDPIRDYQQLIELLDSRLHSETTREDAAESLDRTLRLLARLFLPPDLRLPELEDLAAMMSPSPGDAQRLLGLVATPTHLDYFFARVQTVEWLTLLEPSGLVSAPTDGAWVVFRVAGRLTGEEGGALVAWLRDEYARCHHSPRRCWFVCRAAIDAGDSSVVLDAIREHPQDAALAHLAVWALEDLDPTSDLVVDVLDIVLNEGSGLGDHADHVLDRLVDGVTVDNWEQRVRLLCFKLRALDPDRRDWRLVLHERAGSIADPDDLYEHERFSVLLSALVRCLQRVAGFGVPHANLLDALEHCPGEVRDRVVPWLLGEVGDVAIDELIGRLAEFIRSRPPCGDDLRLVDRVVAVAPQEAYLARWADALGEAPQPEEVAIGLNDAGHHERWYDVRWWSAVLPEPVWEKWSDALAVLGGAFGPASRAALENRREVESGWGTSPISQAEIAALPVDEAARSVASWRPDPNAFLVSARELGRALQADVATRPQDWASDPIGVISALRHPTYIAHYFHGLAAAQEVPIERGEALLQAVSVALAHPWQPVALGRDDGFDYDSDWSGVDDSAVDLINKLATNDAPLGSREPDAWEIVLRFARDRTRPSGVLSEDMDPLETAINRPCMRALEAVFALAGREFRLNGTANESALELVDESLLLGGRDGAEARAEIAPRFAFLFHIAPEWTRSRAELLFGAAAPDGLGQLTIDQALKWARPHPWILEHHRSAIVDAVRRKVGKALWAMLVGMLWDVPGYTPAAVLGTLRSLADDHVSDAGEALARLLREGEVDTDHLGRAVEFWRLALDGNMSSLMGFGWWSEVSALDDTTWREMTLRTLERTGGSLAWSHHVAVRAAHGSTVTGLAILNELVRGETDQWDRHQVMQTALQALRSSDDQVRATDEWRRLRTSLIERGIFDAKDV